MKYIGRLRDFLSREKWLMLLLKNGPILLMCGFVRRDKFFLESYHVFCNIMSMIRSKIQVRHKEGADKL